MKFKIYLLIIILIFAISHTWAQENILSTDKDTLRVQEVASDTLGLQAIIDSLSNVDKEIDKTAYLDLFAKVEDYKTQSRKNFIADENKKLYWSIQGHLFGLVSDNYHIRRDNFTELNSLYPSYLKLQNYNRFYQESQADYFIELTKDYYNLPVTAIEVVASTGDYDLATGYFALKKNEFLDRFNLDFRMNFVKGDFFYGSELASNTSANLIIPYSNSSLDIAFNSIAYEGPYHRLSPAFMLKTAIFEDNSQSLSALYKNDIINFGLKYFSETYKGITDNTLEQNKLQILMNKDLRSDHWQANFNYEAFFGKTDFYNQEINALSSDIDHLLDLSLKSFYDKINLDNRLLLTYPYQLLTKSEINYKLQENISLNAFTDFKESLQKKDLIKGYSPGIDSDTGQELSMPIYYLNEKNNSGLSLKYTSKSLNLALALGNSIIETKLLNTLYKQDFQAFKTEFQGKINRTYGKYAFKISSKMRFYQVYDNKNIHYLPKANLTNSFEIARDVNHNNYIKVGASYHFFDAYLAFDDTKELLHPETSLLDLYLGFQISKLFEINLYWKNILDEQVIAGYRTIPQSITVLMSWNFLN